MNTEFTEDQLNEEADREFFEAMSERITIDTGCNGTVTVWREGTVIHWLTPSGAGEKDLGPAADAYFACWKASATRS